MPPTPVRSSHLGLTPTSSRRDSTLFSVSRTQVSGRVFLRGFRIVQGYREWDLPNDTTFFPTVNLFSIPRVTPFQSL